jgi:hypothetical protein
MRARGAVMVRVRRIRVSETSAGLCMAAYHSVSSLFMTSRRRSQQADPGRRGWIAALSGLSSGLVAERRRRLCRSRSSHVDEPPPARHVPRIACGVGREAL